MSTGERGYLLTLVQRGRAAAVRVHVGQSLPYDPAVIELGDLAERRLVRAGRPPRHLELVR